MKTFPAALAFLASISAPALSADVIEHDKVVHSLPDGLLGDWCGDDANELHRCGKHEIREIHVSAHSYVTDTLCKIKRIIMAPDRTYFVEADCLAEGANVVVSKERSSMHLADIYLRWNK
jgi:hypothetical protein